ncbi:hypothetical protein HPC62_16195 [Thermoleptolyngbya sichuanensis A183]|uniref:Terminase small subunit n=1 Tax=Thermoleptolyngbya sichuanensis A183 TaxID=2737172 RepID=A0A6M8B919_9CYAN|nr:terminase small subunit [Thermoleptolyngbya sichuanensis]QKD83534.1 hypothetical protein HPC62_16195 [Thermoleptolyngbya sichuanensis A183]
MPPKPRALNQLQDRFCAEYVEDFDNIEAARRAGYRHNSDADLVRIAGGLLGNVNVQQRIAELVLERSPLTEQQKWVARHYLQGGCTQTDAYRKAGYRGDADSLAAAASRLFARPVFKRYLRDLQRSLMLRYQVDHDWVLERAKEWVESSNVDITEVADVQSDGTLTLKDLKKLPRYKVLGIKEISCNTSYSEEGEARVSLKIKLHERNNTALSLIARHIGFTSDYNAALNTLHKYGYDVQENEDGSIYARPFDLEEPEKADAEPDDEVEAED